MCNSSQWSFFTSAPYLRMLWRKRSRGTAGEKGDQWVERVLSFRQTCRSIPNPLTMFPLMLSEAVLRVNKLIWSGLSKKHRDYSISWPATLWSPTWTEWALRVAENPLGAFFRGFQTFRQAAARFVNISVMDRLTAPQTEKASQREKNQYSKI